MSAMTHSVSGACYALILGDISAGNALVISLVSRCGDVRPCERFLLFEGGDAPRGVVGQKVIDATADIINSLVPRTAYGAKACPR